MLGNALFSALLSGREHSRGIVTLSNISDPLLADESSGISQSGDSEKTDDWITHITVQRYTHLSARSNTRWSWFQCPLAPHLVR